MEQEGALAVPPASVGAAVESLEPRITGAGAVRPTVHAGATTTHCARDNNNTWWGQLPTWD